MHPKSTEYKYLNHLIFKGQFHLQHICIAIKFHSKPNHGGVLRNEIDLIIII